MSEGTAAQKVAIALPTTPEFRALVGPLIIVAIAFCFVWHHGEAEFGLIIASIFAWLYSDAEFGRSPEIYLVELSTS